ncbi:hypothetical protein PMAYCL1PPCAC_13527, partial [Pristionchus mayeri]
STMANVLAAKMGAGKSQYGLAVETSTLIQTTEKTIDAAEKLLKSCTELKKDFGDSVATHFEKAANTAAAYGKGLQNPEAIASYTVVQTRFVAAAAARRTFSASLDANQIKTLQAFKEDIKGARAAMKGLDAARKGVAVAMAKAKGKEGEAELAAALTAAQTEAANVEKATADALTAFNQKAGQMIIDQSDKLAASEKTLNAATKVALAPA